MLWGRRLGRLRNRNGANQAICLPCWRYSPPKVESAFDPLIRGHMPLPVVEEDIARGILIPIAVEGLPPARSAPMFAIYRADAPPGRAGRWLIDRLKAPKTRSKQPDRPQVPIRSPAHRWLNQRRPGPGNGAIFQRDDPDRPAGHRTITCLTRRAGGRGCSCGTADYAASWICRGPRGMHAMR
jgi:hypothetical protein